MLKAIAALVVVLCSTIPATARSYQLLVDNSPGYIISLITVKGGEVTDFKPRFGTFTVTVTLPDTVCIARVRVHFNGWTFGEHPNFNFCHYHAIVLH